MLAPAALAVWPRLARPLARARVLTQVDLLALALVCTAVADALAAPSGKKLRAALSGLAEFGATPSSRTRIHALAAPSEPDELDLLLHRRPGPAS
jgi:phage terminase small subunit